MEATATTKKHRPTGIIRSPLQEPLSPFLPPVYSDFASGMTGVRLAPGNGLPERLQPYNPTNTPINDLVTLSWNGASVFSKPNSESAVKRGGEKVEVHLYLFHSEK